MATAPTVQTLDQIMAELQPGYAGQRKVIAKGMLNTNEAYKASELAPKLNPKIELVSRVMAYTSVTPNKLVPTKKAL